MLVKSLLELIGNSSLEALAIEEGNVDLVLWIFK
jgi:hypothetical protein